MTGGLWHSINRCLGTIEKYNGIDVLTFVIHMFSVWTVVNIRPNYEGNTMNQSQAYDMLCNMNRDAQIRLQANPNVIYDYKLVDQIRSLEAQYQAKIDQARESVQQLSLAVNALRERRLSLELVSE